MGKLFTQRSVSSFRAEGRFGDDSRRSGTLQDVLRPVLVGWARLLVV